MNFTRIDSLHTGDYKSCTANGTGFRVVLWCCGCPIHCEGCHNKDYWSFDIGKKFTDDDLETIIKEVNLPMITGLTLLGGEPMAEQNVDEMIHIAQTVKERCPGKTIWVYSGYQKEYLMGKSKQKQLLDLCDVLVDGPFKIELRNISLRFRGSKNQVIWEKDSKGEFYRSSLND